MSESTSIWLLITEASWIVQLVMLLLVLASVACWTLIFKVNTHLNNTRKQAEEFEQQFWSGADLGELFQAFSVNKDQDSGLARIFIAGFREFSRLRKKVIPKEAILEGVQRTMRIAFNREQERLEENLPFIATVGSASPYVGLFGTVIGVMNSFRGLSSLHQTTLSAVAPGIAEALIATAMGLVAAIPAVVAYNRFSAKTDALFGVYNVFIDEFISILHRKLYTANLVEEHQS